MRPFSLVAWFPGAIRNRFFACLRNSSGSIFPVFAFVLPVVLGFSGAAIDYARAISQRSAMQFAVDAAAMAAAKEIAMTDSSRESLTAVAEMVVKAQMAMRDALAVDQKPRVSLEVLSDPIQVNVSANLDFEPSFGHAFGVPVVVLGVTASARIVGRPNICVLALNPSVGGTLSLEHKARVTGDNCAVYSNSKHNMGVKSKNDALLEATFICSAGGVQNDGVNFNPFPLVDCPQFEDPLGDRPEPAVGACDPVKPTVITMNTTLLSGTYCGLEVKAGATVTLDGKGGGVFVFKDKPLVIRNGGALIGLNAGLFFTGGSATFRFEMQSTIDLAAPTGGPLAGLLVFASRSKPPTGAFEILSDNARRLIGTIYIPKGELIVDAEKPVADKSAYTAVVADTIRLFGGPHLVLHTDYGATDVPVPDGVKGVGQPVRLIN